MKSQEQTIESSVLQRASPASAKHFHKRNKFDQLYEAAFDGRSELLSTDTVSKITERIDKMLNNQHTTSPNAPSQLRNEAQWATSQVSSH
jgi:hypothetical protein